MPFRWIPPRFRDRSEMRGFVGNNPAEDGPEGWSVVPLGSIRGIRDPHHRLDLPVTRGIYETLPSGAMEARVLVHNQGEDDLLAQRMARDVVLLLQAHRSRLGRRTVFARNAGWADVWLVPSTAADPSVGGESRTSHVYIWDCRFNRSRIEWARTLCHEWGHQSLPAARGYVAPEGDASGKLGEALYMEWVARNADSARDEGYLSTELASTWSERHNRPRRERFQSLGPNDPNFARRDEIGMDAYIGSALALGESFGWTILGQAMQNIENDSPVALLSSLRRQLRESASVLVRLPVWIPLEKGSYRIESIERSGPLAIDGAPARGFNSPRTINLAKAGWHRVHSPGNMSGVISVTKVAS